MAYPNDIPTLYAWYRADSFALTEGQVAGNWTDKSGNGRTMVVSGSPIYRASVIAGQPALEFFGAESYMHSTFGWRANLADHTLFGVFLSKTRAAAAPGFIGSDGGSSSECLGFDYGSSPTRVIGRATQAALGQVTIGVNCAVGGWHFAMERQASAATIYLSLDGGAEISAAIGARDTTYPTTVGQLAVDGGSFWVGQLAEAIVYSSQLSSGQIQSIYDYIRARYFVVTPAQNEAMRDVLSRRLWNLRRPPGLLEVKVPLWMLDADILDRVAIEAVWGPAPQGAGWMGKKWQRRAFSIQRLEVDPVACTVTLQLLDRKPLDILLWDTQATNEAALTLGSGRASGVARIMLGNLITFSRGGSRAWVVNPADSSSCVEIQQDIRSYTFEGEYLEEARTNGITRSSFLSGITGLTIAGSGTVVADATDLFFNPGMGSNSLKFTAGNPQSSATTCTFPATASYNANVNVRVSLDIKTDNGEPLYWRLQRGVDSWFWNDVTAAWQSGSVDNPITSHSDRNPASQFVSQKIGVGGNATSLTLTVLLQTGGTVSRISHLYHAQIEQGSYASSRIVCDGSALTRAATQLSIAVPSTAKCYNPGLGTFWAQLLPNWTSSDLASSEKMTLFYMTTNSGADHDWLYYDPSTGQWVFERKVGGSIYKATLTVAVPRKVRTSIAARWTGSDGELGLSAYTLSIFVDGVQGSDVVSAAPNFAASGETLYVGSDSSFANQVNGAMQGLRIFPDAKTIEEITRLP